ncbi:MAG: MFS transporter [Acidimicrobiaceae bacterium]|jgi:MFS family permease|nr:MFS transporter [Ilumatobacteraceae bacterium]
MTNPSHRDKRQKSAPRPGTARAAFSYPDFRMMWTANFLSSIGTWMQNVVLPAYVYQRTGSASVVGVFIFAQLGPLLLLSIPAGVLADKFDRRKWLVFAQIIQMAGSILLGVFTISHSPIWSLFFAQMIVGIGNAFNAPAFSAVLPSLVKPEDLGGSISLSSASVNGSRVTGPVVVAVMMSWGVTTGQVFLFNAATYLFVTWAVLRISIPSVAKSSEKGLKALTSGFRIARERRAIGRVLLTMSSFSLLSLAYVGLFPAVADLTFDIEPKSALYKWLYATWGLGAMFGALAIGTVLAGMDKRKTARMGFIAFAVTMCAFASVRGTVLAFITAFFLGIAYFGTTTALTTVVQSRLESEVRGRVMALWFMAFGGTIPIGNVIFGPIMDAIGSRPVLYIGAAWALFLSWWCNIEKIDNETARSV